MLTIWGLVLRVQGLASGISDLSEAATRDLEGS